MRDLRGRFCRVAVVRTVRAAGGQAPAGGRVSAGRQAPGTARLRGVGRVRRAGRFQWAGRFRAVERDQYSLSGETNGLQAVS
ncbi:hypothetical protein GCM10010428_72290 [Actinosynnema pretiosum subsp. pretiosum]